MKKALVVLALCLFAREDPFELKMSPKTSQQSVKGEINKPLTNIEVTLPTTTRILREVHLVYQKLDGSIATEIVKINSDIDWHYPISISQIQNKEEFELKKPKSYNAGEFEFVITGKKIHIASPYKIKQIFVLPKPYRIILDLERGDKVINQNLKLDRYFFTAVSIGTHQKFYRVSLELDGQYGYDLEQDDGGYSVILK